MKTIFRKCHAQIFFVVAYCLGLALVPQYPVDIDEPSLRSHGTFNLINAVRILLPSALPTKYSACDAISCFPSLENWNAFTHGAWFEMLLSLLEFVFGFENTSKLGGDNFHQIYLMRHYVTFSLCFVGLVNLYYLLRREFRSSQIAYTGVGLAITSPRLFSSGFWDVKNMIFLSMLTIGINFLSKYFTSRKLGFLLASGVILGLSAGRRIVGVGAILVVGLLIALHSRNKGLELKFHREKLNHSFLFLLIGFVSLVVSMPYLWSSPLIRFLGVLKGNANFQLFKGLIWYDGRLVSPSNLPRSYLPHWIFITMPIYQLVLLTLSLLMISWWLISRKMTRIVMQHPAILAYLLFCLICIIYVFVFNPVNYAGWAHFYFLQLGFVLIGCAGIKIVLDFFSDWLNIRWARIIIFGSLLLASMPSVTWMLLNHPYQRSYFNSFAGPKEMIPYNWSEASGYGLELFAFRWIIQNDDSRPITIDSVGNFPLSTATNLLNSREVKKLCFVGRNPLCKDIKPKYIIDTLNYDVSFGEGSKGDFQKPSSEDYKIEKVWKIEGQPLMYLYKKVD